MAYKSTPQQNKKPKKRWSVSVYLGKENYEAFSELANSLRIPLSSLCRILISSGKQFADAMEENYNAK